MTKVCRAVDSSEAPLTGRGSRHALTCPRHFCQCCRSKALTAGQGNKLHCWRCLKGYHMSCQPEGAVTLLRGRVMECPECAMEQMQNAVATVRSLAQRADKPLGADGGRDGTALQQRAAQELRRAQRAVQEPGGQHQDVGAKVALLEATQEHLKPRKGDKLLTCALMLCFRYAFSNGSPHVLVGDASAPSCIGSLAKMKCSADIGCSTSGHDFTWQVWHPCHSRLHCICMCQLSQRPNQQLVFAGCRKLLRPSGGWRAGSSATWTPTLRQQSGGATNAHPQTARRQLRPAAASTAPTAATTLCSTSQSRIQKARIQSLRSVRTTSAG